MATTTNFGWETPDDTDLVKDGALAMRTLGNAIDASMVDLKGGTTGQVLSKASNTDMDFTWVAQDDSNAIQNAIVDAKGDLIAASAADTPARLAVGNNGETLVADSSATTGLRWQGNYAAGKNKIINGDFAIWQRGTSFTDPASGVYTADRYRASNTTNPTSRTISQQTFTPGAAPVAGYEGTFFLRSTLTTVGSSTGVRVQQRIEDVRTLAGETVTLSFYAKSDSNRTNTVVVEQSFGSGGSAAVETLSATNFNTTTAWTRFSFTFTNTSISGKTIGTNSFLLVSINQALADGCVLDLWGLQLEAGNTATAFQTATGTLAGELAACQRYYFRNSATGVYSVFSPSNPAQSTTAVDFAAFFPVTMRIAPTSIEYSNVAVTDNNSLYSTGTFALQSVGTSTSAATIRYTHGTAALTQFRPYFAASNNSASGYLAFNAEL